MDKQMFASMIVKYWYLVEFLGQPNFPAQSKKGRKLCQEAADGNISYKQLTVYHTLPGKVLRLQKRTENLPSDPGAALKQDMRTYYSYGVISDEINLCLGKMERYVLAERLKQAFRPDLELPEKNHSPVCLIGMKCDKQGRYIPGSINISPLAWGVNQLLAHADELTEENIADFLSIDMYQLNMNQWDNQLVELEDEAKVGKILTSSLLTSITKSIERKYLSYVIQPGQEMNWEGVLIYRRYRTEEIKAQDADVFHYSDLYNSFFANDLNMVEQAISYGKMDQNPLGNAIFDYITGVYAEENPNLHWMNLQERIDVQRTWEKGKKQEQADFFHHHLDIDKAPLGKWPSRFMPCLMQQLAINLSWKPSSENLPIFSVNGPPGTGKTTLLKEIIAGNVVERACMLAKYEDPDEAFVQKCFQDGDKPHRGYSKFYWGYYDFNDEQLKDYGMLVASSNNAAVENITKELSDGTALLKGIQPEKEEGSIRGGLLEVQNLFRTDESTPVTYTIWNESQDRYEPREYPDLYFTKLANDLAKRKDGEWDRWGLISAPFGKSSNLGEYMRAVLKPYIKSFGSNDCIQQGKLDYSDAVHRFKKQYKKVELMKQALQRISSARKIFMQKKEFLQNRKEKLRVLQEQQEQSAERLLKEIQEFAKQSKEAKELLKNYRTKYTDLQTQKSRQDEYKVELEKRIENIRQQILEAEGRRRIWDILLELIHRPTMLSRIIQEQYQALELVEQELQMEEIKENQLRQELKNQRNMCKAQELSISKMDDRKNKLSKKRQTCLRRVKQVELQIGACQKQIEEADNNYQEVIRKASECQTEQGMIVLNEDFFHLYDSKKEEESTIVQVANPWHTPAYNREREKLFYEALQLHKAFLLGSKACLWNFKNLLLLWNKQRDDDKKTVTFSHRDREAAFSSLLNTVFLLTPVLSTTFASAGNMLASIREPGEIGCLIIDEAGQASPQMALGSLYRCRRAIVVGDPKQVEPVVTDELDLIKQIIQNRYTVYYQSKTHSVQEFADRLNTIGTIYADDGYETWVGCPLVVHRRCISPMFEISNALSYNNMMRQQTTLPNLEKEAGFCRESSGWINVSGSENNSTGKDHYVDTQGRKAWEFIRNAFQKSKGIPNLFVITPFTTVREGLRKMICSQPEYQKDKRFQEWADQCIGTVHTFQGKEADEVIFLLGCDKNALPAVRWVNANIVNVAVTRAKYRLYVIGDYTVWRQSPLFQKVKGILDSFALRSLHKIADNTELCQDEKQIERLFKQMPGPDSLTIDGELEDSLAAPFYKELEGIWKDQVLTSAQLKKFGLTWADLDQLSPIMKKRLNSSILLHEMFAALRKQYQIEELDASCAGILFCKTMESLLKEVLLGKLKAMFPNEGIFKKKLGDIKEEKATTGTFTYILNKEPCRL